MISLLSIYATEGEIYHYLAHRYLDFILDADEIPLSLKLRVTIPVYKGGGN